jgi:hypothetical protein
VLAFSGLSAAAAADGIAIIAAETIVAAVVAGQIAEAAVPAEVLDSNGAPAAASIVIMAATPDRRAVLSSFPKC